jgi:hypothetical protein
MIRGPNAASIRGARGWEATCRYGRNTDDSLNVTYTVALDNVRHRLSTIKRIPKSMFRLWRDQNALSDGGVHLCCVPWAAAKRCARLLCRTTATPSCTAACAYMPSISHTTHLPWHPSSYGNLRQELQTEPPQERKSAVEGLATSTHRYSKKHFDTSLAVQGLRTLLNRLCTISSVSNTRSRAAIGLIYTSRDGNWNLIRCTTLHRGYKVRAEDTRSAR